MSRYAEYIKAWHNCQLCGLCKTRKNIVLGRGTLPSEVAFIGEAPGEIEDSFGSPFKGPAGRLFFLDILPQVVESCGPFTYSVNNLLACVPWEDRVSCKVRDPLPDEIEKCSPRLAEFLDMANPNLIVTLGQLAAKWVPKIRPEKLGKVYILKLPHPAAIARIKTQAQKSFAIRQSAVHLSTALLNTRG